MNVTTGKTQERFPCENAFDLFIISTVLMQAERKEGRFKDDRGEEQQARGDCLNYLYDMEKPVLGRSLCVGHRLFRQHDSLFTLTTHF